MALAHLDLDCDVRPAKPEGEVDPRTDLGSWPEAGGATGLAAGDAICRTLARDAALPDPGGFVAWLSDSTADAIDRLGGFPGPWQRLDGVQAVRLGPLGPELDTSLSITERRETVEFYAWTGTDDAGQWTGIDCDGWTDDSVLSTGSVGYVDNVYFWTNITAEGCFLFYYPIYCFGTAMVLFLDGFESGDAGRWSAVDAGR